MKEARLVFSRYRDQACWFLDDGTQDREHFVNGVLFPSRYYCTDNHGEGIFLIDLIRNRRVQIVGTCEFSLAGIKDPRNKIRRWMNS